MLKIKETLFVSFSGGRTSGYMCWYLINSWSHKYNFIFVFANTGLEHEKTLAFVDQCDREFGLNLVWVEAVIHKGKREGTTHKIVDFRTACRCVRLFEDMVKVYGIPNQDYPHCNRELKLQAMRSYKESIGFERMHKMAIGIRVDEFDRMSGKADEEGLVYPLITMKPTTKPEVRHWWNEQSFDLEIDEHEGNCVTCWKKSDRKLFTLAKHEPLRFKDFDYLEKTYSHIKIEGQSLTDRVFYRKYRSAHDIVELSKQPFTEFKDYMPELQLTFDLDPLDVESDCGAGCEIS